MSLFGNIMNKIFHHSSAKEPEPAGADAGQIAPAQPQPETTQPSAAPATATSAPSRSVDVGAVLSEMAAAKGGGGNYKTSIGDLLEVIGTALGYSAVVIACTPYVGYPSLDVRARALAGGWPGCRNSTPPPPRVTRPAIAPHSDSAAGVRAGA